LQKEEADRIQQLAKCKELKVLNVNSNSKISELKEALSQQFKQKADIQAEIDNLESRMLQLLEQLQTQELSLSQFQSK